MAKKFSLNDCYTAFDKKKGSVEVAKIESQFMQGNGQVNGLKSNIDRHEQSTQQRMMIPDATLQSDYGVSMQLMGLSSSIIELSCIMHEMA